MTTAGLHITFFTSRFKESGHILLILRVLIWPGQALMTQVLFFVLMLSGLSSPMPSATDLSLSPLEVIHRNGQLNVTDGKRVYTLKSDGSFCSFSGLMSGVVIQGKWKIKISSDTLTVEIKASWKRVNTISQDEVKTAILEIHSGVLHDTGRPQTDLYNGVLVWKDVVHVSR